MRIRVGRIPYLNAEPFYFDMPRRGLELYSMVPSALADALERDEIDAGPVPVADCFRLSDQKYQPVSGFCIATTERSRSILLYSQKPFAELGGARIGVTPDTSTSKQLLRVLLTLKYQVQPEAFVGLKDDADAFLLIGDEALRQRRGMRGIPHRYDLGEEWFNWTKLPFVFARWIAKKDMPQQDFALLEDNLYVGLDSGVDEIYHTSDPRDDLRMMPRDIVDYIRGSRYFMGLSEYKGLELFQKYLAEVDPKLVPGGGVDAKTGRKS